ncbi:hypothetical protein GS462_25830 [Rhodococcus hoagii]|nr:hypothetical protein [Prescottella equi]
MLSMKPKTFALIVGAIIMFGGGAATQNIAVMLIGFLIMVGAWFVKWPQSADSRAQDERDHQLKQERRDERARSLARRFRR